MRAIITIILCVVLAIYFNQVEGMTLPLNMLLSLSILQTVLLFAVLTKVENLASTND